MESPLLSTSVSKKLTGLTLNPLFISLALFILITVFIKSQFATIPAKTLEAPENVFSSERAYNMLAQLTKEQVPHPVDSEASRVVERRIVGLLRDMGYQAEIQQTQLCRDSKRGFARCTTIRNVIVKIQGTSAEKNGILLAAHYDSVPAGPGGSDAGAAVGTLLETARLLTLEKQPLNTIVLLFNEGEEFGLFGAKAFMEQHPLAKDLAIALNVEARGSTGKSVMFETGENSGWLVEHYADTTPAPLSSSLFYEVYKALPNDTDLTVFKDHGLQGLNFAHAERLAHYHTPLDNIANLNKGSLQHHGDNVWGVLKRIKDQNLDNVIQGNLVYSDIMSLFIISWAEPTSLWLSLACLTVFISFWIYRRKMITAETASSNKLTIKQHVITLFSPILLVTASALIAYLVMIIVQFISGYHAPWFSNALPMQLAVWLSVVSVCFLVGRALCKFTTVESSLNAISLLWIILSLVSSIWVAGISFLFIIPAFANIICQIILNTIPTKKKNIRVLVLMITAAVSAVMFIPVAFTIIVMMGYALSVAIGLILGFVAVSTLPILVLCRDDKNVFNQLLSLTTLFAVISIFWLSLQSPHSTWLPQRLNINYVENGQGQAFISYGYSRAIIPSTLTDSFEQKPQLIKLLPWSRQRSYVAEVAIPSSDSFPDKTPAFRIIETKQNGDEYTVTAQIVTDPNNLSDIKLYVPISAKLKSIETNNRSLSYQNERNIRNGYYEYHCRGISCANIEITLHFDDYQTGELYVSSAYPGLPNAMTPHLKARGNTSVPSQSGDQSIRYRSFAF